MKKVGFILFACVMTICAYAGLSDSCGDVSKQVVVSTTGVDHLSDNNNHSMDNQTRKKCTYTSPNDKLHCGGDGRCSLCGGDGLMDAFGLNNAKCSLCNGTGVCVSCNGTGYIYCIK